jgi:hypothetical protein
MPSAVCIPRFVAMTTQQEIGILDPATVDRLSTAFNDCFSRLDASPDLFSSDVFFDLYPPLWRFQVQGPDAFVAQLRAIAQGPTHARILHVTPTATGFVLEHEESMGGEHPEVARRMWRCEVRDGRITEVVGFCNGGWDDELRARHAAEAPMLRP